ncbi:MAG TPA: hypothetical protein VGS57_01300 [Thermoanaerobaculia bacterium]|jgi:hypothetical protein|nr:hypothetical protein [Thermoanaerobaculia bacterium]
MATVELADTSLEVQDEGGCSADPEGAAVGLPEGAFVVLRKQRSSERPEASEPLLPAHLRKASVPHSGALRIRSAPAGRMVANAK